MQPSLVTNEGRRHGHQQLLLFATAEFTILPSPAAPPLRKILLESTRMPAAPRL